MDGAVNSCMSYLRNNRDLSFNTIDSYERDIRQYVGYLKRIGIDEPRQAGKEVLESYLGTLIECGKSFSTITRNMASLRAFYRYLIRNGLVDGNPIIGVEVPRNINRPSNKPIAQIISRLPEAGYQDKKKLRDRAILELIYLARIKVSHLISLDVDQINLEKACVSYYVKSKKREKPISSSCVESLYNYLRHSRPYLLKDSQERSLFINSSGKRISRQGIWKIKKKYLGAMA